MAEADAKFMRTLRELARCYQAFESFSEAHIRATGLTSAQFDIIATLGNTRGLSFKDLGERTLITKGTLTGVIDRLEARELVRRTECPHDGRSQIVVLTSAGEKLFRRIFPAHMAHLSSAFAAVPETQLLHTELTLRRLRELFEAAHELSLEEAEMTGAARSRPRRAA
ncbi:MAG TPA: MarR family transcriptional regulator [Rhodocyclaceae bacterium]|nr:MarR family transcriptional regulator [Rhodocyclaceae bacterium]HMV55368.1 MarR family transcriptional regulator [Rhodocyclaceae bacterium]HNA04531.1 MarR family transcriptional regulator [Rhodocyclaceae bacterium]HNB80183.1 MarR family transcriptional regulator [Rhodocyclaceae bacterium]HNC62716.1 MarR family transcriptional regulator [Rhodocyclaceae bacterium]